MQLSADSYKRLDRVSAGLRTVSYVGRAGVLLLMLHVVADTSLRYLLNRPIPGTLEYAQYWYMPAICLLGFVLAQQRGEHIAAPVVFDRLPGPMQRELTIVMGVLTVFILLAYSYFGFTEALQQMERGTRGAAAGVIIWPPRFLVPIGAAACAVEAALSLLRGGDQAG